MYNERVKVLLHNKTELDFIAETEFYPVDEKAEEGLPTEHFNKVCSVYFKDNNGGTHYLSANEVLEIAAKIKEIQSEKKVMVYELPF